jgi:tRNA threonylcarbamoyladenosine biosynthesis protein TsaB
MRLLALETATLAGGAALLDDGRLVGESRLNIALTHSERLMLIVDRLLQDCGWEAASLDGLAVSIGPGSFTGLRVGLAFAKGLGLALARPVVGIGALEALGAEEPGRTLALADARRGQVYWQAFEDGRLLTEASASSLDDAAAFFVPDIVTGPGADLVADRFPGALVTGRPGADPAVIARLGAARLDPERPRPLYLRTPDAKLPGGVEPEWQT